ncbi:MAG: hypothetical protein R3F43_25425 [bacterium]
MGGAGRARRSARPAVRRPGADWATLNRPINYLLAATASASSPPGRGYLLPDFPGWWRPTAHLPGPRMCVARPSRRTTPSTPTAIAINAEVGLTLSVVKWEANRVRPSQHPEPAGNSRQDRVEYITTTCTWTACGQPPSTPIWTASPTSSTEWRDALDWLGVQYYFRAGVTGSPGLIPALGPPLASATSTSRRACRSRTRPGGCPTWATSSMPPACIASWWRWGALAGLPLTVTGGHRYPRRRAAGRERHADAGADPARPGLPAWTCAATTTGR